MLKQNCLKITAISRRSFLDVIVAKADKPNHVDCEPSVIQRRYTVISTNNLTTPLDDESYFSVFKSLDHAVPYFPKWFLFLTLIGNTSHVNYE